jgi:5-methylcytosine-specific restriction enzyme subunit McrC
MVASPKVLAKAKPSPIAVKNLYYMYLYAWEMFSEGTPKEIASTEGITLHDLLAKVLVTGVRRLLRRRMDRSYLEFVEETASPRGSFLLNETMRPGPRSRGTAVCAFDDLDPDVPHNRVIKAALRTLANSADMDQRLCEEMTALLTRMPGVANVRLSRNLFRSVQLGRNNRHYRLLIKICELVFENLIPGEGERQSRFADIFENENRLCAVFEKFVLNFNMVQRKDLKVRAEQLSWNASFGEISHKAFLPNMRTDITMRAPGRTLIVDAKYYRAILSTNRSGAAKLRSGHLYQLFTYLRQVSCDLAVPHVAEGILLYAKAGGTDLALRYEVGGYSLRAQTIDLDQPWHLIHAELLAFIA